MTQQVQNQRDYAGPTVAVLEPEVFSAIADYAKGAFGLHLPPAKREMVFARLIKRLRRVGAVSFSDYLALVQRPENDGERSEFLSALTTNVTQFFREPHHFAYLKSKVLPALLTKAREGQRIRLWSAGCSAGQEAYSLAMQILELCPDANALNIKILATDIDPRILQRATACTYPNEELPTIPAPMQAAFVRPASNDTFTFVQPIRELITFAELNLMDEWPMRGSFDIIFCRNVAIYFDAPTQSRLWHRFSGLLTGDGHLFIGHSERLSGPAMHQMQSVGVTVYHRRKDLNTEARA